MVACHVIEGAFSAEDCAGIAALADGAVSQEARLVGQRRDHNRRRAELVWLDDVPGSGWVMDRLIDVVRAANRARFDFALDDFSESPQVARYRAAGAGHFDWHTDIGDGPVARRRKLTLVVQLSDAGEYAGGTLEVMPTSAVIAAPRSRGAAILFPAFALHRVTPVTEGTRQSLTVWAHGPAFR